MVDDERRASLGFLDSLYASVVVMAITTVADRHRTAAPNQILAVMAPLIGVGLFLLDDWLSARVLLQRHGYADTWRGRVRLGLDLAILCTGFVMLMFPMRAVIFLGLLATMCIYGYLWAWALGPDVIDREALRADWRHRSIMRSHFAMTVIIVGLAVVVWFFGYMLKSYPYIQVDLERASVYVTSAFTGVILVVYKYRVLSGIRKVQANAP